LPSDPKYGFVTSIERSYGRRLRNAAADTPDLMQEVYLRLLRVDDQDAIRNPQAYLFTVASHVLHQHALRQSSSPDSEALDRSAPPEEAVQFHNALLENGTRSVLVIYPLEGHGIRQFPAVMDYAARVVSWFTEHV